MRKRIASFICLGALACALALGACSGDSSSDEKEYIDESEISAMFSDPDSYKGMYAELSGMVFTTPEESGDTVYLQVYHDVANYEENFVVEVSADLAEEIEEYDYIVVDGKIAGSYSGENLLGVTVTCPKIEADSLEEGSYIDIVVPALTTIEPGTSEEQNGFTVTVDKVEYAAEETRVYVTCSNSSDDTISFGAYSIMMIVDDQQIEQEDALGSAYEGDYDELSYEVLSGKSTSGIVVFPAMEEGASFELVIPDIYSDDWETDFDDMYLDIDAG